MADGNRLYPAIEPLPVESSEPAATASPRVSDHYCDDAEESQKFPRRCLGFTVIHQLKLAEGAGFSLNEDHRAISPVNDEFSTLHISQTKQSKTNMIESSTGRKQGKYFYYDLTDLSTLRSWLNFPWGQSIKYEICKAANIIPGYRKVGLLKLEKSIPDAILKQAKGLAILAVAKVGLMVTYNVGTGLVIARREDDFWSTAKA